MTVHPYIPNSVPEIKKKMLKEIEIKSADELFACIPDAIRLKRRLNLPPPTPEQEVRKHVESILAKNRNREILSFLGAGCWPHYVPAICDEINSRSEFLTAYTGDVYSDLGRYQALFEFQCMIGELVAMDAVTFPTYDWATAAGDAARMAALVTGRHRILVPKTMSPDKLNVISAFCSGLADLESVNYDHATGQISLEDLNSKMSPKVAGVYIDNPSYLGFIEERGDEIALTAHKHGALSIVGVEPISLGLLTPPGEYGADIVCGEGQPLGIHMCYGGAMLGFLACRDDQRFASATGHRMITLTRTKAQDAWGFAYVLPERSMFAAREKSASFTGTATVLWAITAAVYLSLLGPQGIRELAETIMQKSHYAMKRLSEIKGIKAPLFDSTHFTEFTVNFDGVRKGAKEANERLLKRGIQGGKDLSKEFREMENTALYCVTEVHSKEDIDRLASSLEEVVR